MFGRLKPKENVFPSSSENQKSKIIFSVSVKVASGCAHPGGSRENLVFAVCILEAIGIHWLVDISL